MKRVGNLWDSVVSWDNIVIAAAKARRGKRGRDCVREFEFDLERNLIDIQKELITGKYCPGGFNTHWISKPKPRLISAAPYKDRVIHHCIMNVLEPVLDKRFHYDSYACRKGKGHHKAAQRAQQFMKKYKYYLQCDIKKFFPNIDHLILKEQFRRIIKDKRLLGLLDLVVESSNEQEAVRLYFKGDSLFTPIERKKGLPIGNLTSQWFANWYLNGFDHWITKELGFGGYVRYCDDFVIFADSKLALLRLKEIVVAALEDIRLKIHQNKCFIRATKEALTFVGMRIWRDFRLIKKQNIRAFRRRLKWMKTAYRNENIDIEGIRQRLMSWIGHCGNADSYLMLERMSKDWKFIKG